MLDIIKTCRRKGFTARQLLNHAIFRVTARKGAYLRYEPVTLTFAVTDRCTFRCRMCHLHSPVIEQEPHFNVKKKDLPFDLFRDVLGRFSRARNVTFVGTGEPLLHHDFFNMVALADKRHMVTSTITNGLLLDTQIEPILRSSLDHISVSINAYCQEDFVRLTGMEGRHFETILRNIRDLTNARNGRGHALKISVSFILDQENYRHVEKMLGITREVGADACSLHNFIPSSTGGFTANERSLFRSEETVRFFRQIPIPRNMSVSLPHLLRKDLQFAGCHFFFTTLRIDSDGLTGACGGSLLNLNGHPPYTKPRVWNDDYLVSMRERFLLKAKPLPEPCYVCPHNY